MIKQEILQAQRLMPDTIVDNSMNILSLCSDNSTNIAKSFTAVLLQQPGGTEWRRLGLLFLNNSAVHRQDDFNYWLKSLCSLVTLSCNH